MTQGRSKLNKNIVGLSFAVSVLLVSGCDDGSNQAADPASDAAPVVSVITVDTRPFTASVEFVGRTEAYSQVDLRARVTGFLAERPFKEGSDVSAGDVLFRIDTAEFDAAVAAARAGLEKAQAAFTEAEQTLQRSRTLADRGTISEANLDEAVAAMERTRADVAAAKAEVDRAQLNLDYTTIATPIDGRIGKSSVDPGNLIGPDSGILATVVTLDPIRVAFSVTERTFIKVQEERNSGSDRRAVPRIRLANGEMYEPEGTIQFADNRVDPSTGTVSVYVDFPNAEHLLLPGQFVTVILSSSEASEQILVPQAAVQLNQAGPFVLVVDSESKVEVRPITMGDRTGTEVVVLDGLSAGETIIVEGIQKVRPGIAVVTNPQSAGGA
jgi:membrane fusion protein (multidrug efflux system)